MVKKKSPLSPHDRYARSSLIQPEVAKEFFREFLPPHIKKRVDLATLVPQKESYINDKLRAKIVDILFSVNLEEEQGYLYVLMEHASTPDKMLPLRMLQYVLSVMEDHCKRTGESKLPVVYPMIFYTGQKKYKHSTNIYDLFGEHKKLAQSIYTKPYKLIDLNQITDDQLKQYHWLSILGLAMKHIRDMDFLPILKDMLHLFQRIETSGGSGYIYRTLTYVTEAGEVRDPDQFVEVLRQGLKDQEGTVMTLAEHWKQQGRQQGIEQGVQQGINRGITQGIRQAALNMLKAEFSAEQVANLTELSIEDVQELRRQNFS